MDIVTADCGHEEPQPDADRADRLAGARVERSA